MDLTDIGANLAHDSFDADRPAVIERAFAAGVSRIVVTGSCRASAEAAQRLAAAHPGQLFATAGLHPHHAEDFSDDLLARFRALAGYPEVVAIGETGLDFFRDFSPRPRQEAAFRAHLELAAELDMPVFLHQRDAHDRFLPILREYLSALPAAVVHCFTGTGAELDAYLDAGCHIGITGWICDERRGSHLLELVAHIPEGRLMIETDAPYLLPRDLAPKPRSRRNEPLYLPHIAATIARARGETPASLAHHTSAAAETFFRLPARSPAGQ